MNQARARLGSSNLDDELGPAPLEEVVVELALLRPRGARPGLSEAVVVQLPHEGRPVAVLERAGHHRPSEGVHVPHDERPAVLTPAADVRGAARNNLVSLGESVAETLGQMSLTLRRNDERLPALDPASLLSSCRRLMPLLAAEVLVQLSAVGILAGAGMVGSGLVEQQQMLWIWYCDGTSPREETKWWDRQCNSRPVACPCVRRDPDSTDQNPHALIYFDAAGIM